MGVRYNNIDEAVLMAKVKAIYLKTDNIREVAKQLGLSISTASRLVKKLQIRDFPWADALASLKAKGYKVPQIAENLNLSVDYVYGWQSERRPSLPNQIKLIELDKISPSLLSGSYKNSIEELYDKGYIQAEIIKNIMTRTNSSKTAVERWVTGKAVPRSIQVREAIIELNKQLPKKGRQLKKYKIVKKKEIIRKNKHKRKKLVRVKRISRKATGLISDLLDLSLYTKSDKKLNLIIQAIIDLIEKINLLKEEI